MTLGERIQAARKLRGFTRAELGEAAGVSGQAVNQWEIDKNQPESRRLAAIIRKLAVDPMWLLDGEGEPVEMAETPEIMQIWSALTPDQQEFAARMLKALPRPA